jgi:cytidylate kinase
MSQNAKRPKIVAVDGPAGSGKSSICHRVAEQLGWTYLNTGALYRAVGLRAHETGVPLDDEPKMAHLVEAMAPDLRWDAARRELWFGNRNLTPLLLAEEVGDAASKIAKLEGLRERLLPLQRQLSLSAPKGVLVDGRDIGTVVFPDADLKIFLTASLEQRSKRRMQQLGSSLDDKTLLAELMAEMAHRDERDANRDVAPLKQAADAVLLDTSDLSLEETVAAMLVMIQARHLVS